MFVIVYSITLKHWTTDEKNDFKPSTFCSFSLRISSLVTKYIFSLDLILSESNGLTVLLITQILRTIYFVVFLKRDAIILLTCITSYILFRPIFKISLKSLVLISILSGLFINNKLLSRNHFIKYFHAYFFLYMFF